MKSSINLFSEKSGEIKKFLDLFYSQNLFIENDLYYQKEFDSPIEMIDFISCFIDNKEKFDISLWISLDKDVYICVTELNLNSLIKYLYERYPY